MPLEEQNFKMFEGDHQEVTFDIEGIDPTSAKNIYWFTEFGLQKTETDMTITTNSISFEISSEETKGFNGRYKHELKIVDNNDNVSTIARGSMSIIKPLEVI